MTKTGPGRLVAVIALGAVLLGSCTGPSRTAGTTLVTSGVDRTTIPTTVPQATSTTQPIPTTASAPTAPGAVDDLIALLPPATRTPQGWVVSPGAPATGVVPDEGFFVGSCSGGNADARAVANRAWGAAHHGGYDTPEGAAGSVSVFGFPSAEDAEGFVRLTERNGACSATAEVPEGSGRAAYDGFADVAQDGTARWTITETSAADGLVLDGADTALVLRVDDLVRATVAGREYSAQLNEVTAFVRLGRFVIVAGLASYCCGDGYDEPAGTYVASLADLLPLLEGATAHAASVLVERGLL